MNILRKPGSDRVAGYITDMRGVVFRLPYDPIVKITLPLNLGTMLFQPKPGAVFEGLHDAFHSAVIGGSRDHHMQMIRHEAIDRNHGPVPVGCFRKELDQWINDQLVGKQRLTVLNTSRKAHGFPTNVSSLGQAMLSFTWELHWMSTTKSCSRRVIAPTRQTIKSATSGDAPAGYTASPYGSMGEARRTRRLLLNDVAQIEHRHVQRQQHEQHDAADEDRHQGFDQLRHLLHREIHVTRVEAGDLFQHLV